ncbi:probable aquaporin NIP-type [Salvia miltiorrhiza]|uniref:probable aquaporin NIP-type n=1 Tax=Salvia miltiorrhiza TaxID=226208 RepID=UPI0025AC6C36|nr:probable aquaporin NIP-type [Salvia miltiorrhiza]
MAAHGRDIDGLEEGAVRSAEENYRKSLNDEGSTFFTSANVVVMIQKVIAEAVGTYFLIFVGCGSVALNKIYGTITFPGVCLAFGVVVMVMVYSVGHISGAHFNPAVTITMAFFRQFPIRQVPLYILAQLLGAILASGTLYLLLDVDDESFFGTTPVGSHIQSLVMEFIASFLLMFVISGVATDNRAIGEMAGIAIGMTLLIGVLIAGPISGGSMNPARTIGPALILHKYTGIWVYIAGPLLGTVLGGFVYNLIRFTDKPLKEVAKSSATFLKSASRVF